MEVSETNLAPSEVVHAVALLLTTVTAGEMFEIINGARPPVEPDAKAVQGFAQVTRFGELWKFLDRDQRARLIATAIERHGDAARNDPGNAIVQSFRPSPEALRRSQSGDFKPADVAFHDAVAALPAVDHVHVYVQSGRQKELIGMPYTRNDVVSMIHDHGARTSGPIAEELGHGLCCRVPDRGTVFIETRVGWKHEGGAR